ncbi:unnamed protein product [Oikopleura dioica]|uniref:Uncharacterized protein n=1 Tax=Oikopleura dioica TaxID=34765 RepID=E4XYV1_OIKDI|nr:unnamed protein product [Oikopleura dioica]
MNHDLTVTYLEDKSEYIVLADHLSRNPKLSVKCETKSCKVCEAADAPLLKTENLPDRKEFKDEMSNLKFIDNLVPNTSLEQYEANQRIQEDYLWWNQQKLSFEVEVFSPFEAELLNFKVARTNPAIFNDFPELRKATLKSFLANKELVRSIQLKDKKLRAVIRAKENLVLPGARNRPGETGRWKMEIVEGVVVATKNFGIRSLNVTVIPERFTNWIAQKVHDEHGCSSMSSMINVAKSVVEAPKIKDAIKAIIGRCRKCTFMRNVPNTYVDLKEYKDLNPTRIGEIVSWDQLTRRSELKNKQFKYWVLIDHLSAYAKLYPVEGPSSAENNKIALLRALNDIAGPINEPVKVITDGAKYNESLVNDPDLINSKVTLIITTNLTRSKNNLCILDTRTAKMTKYITMALNESDDPWMVAQKAETAHNRIKSAHGFSPLELFKEIDQVTGELIKVDWDKIKMFIKKARKMSRAANDKMARKKAVRDPINLIPFDEESEEGRTYGNVRVSPIKLGDIIILSGAFDKNNSRPWWKVCSSEQIPDGIDFDNRVVSTIKMDLRKIQKSSRKLWSFSAIKAVCDGREKLTENELHGRFKSLPEKFDANYLILDDNFKHLWT